MSCEINEDNSILNEELDILSNVTINEKSLSDEDLMKAYAQSENLTLIPLLKLIYSTVKIDYGNDFKLKIPLSSNHSKEIPLNGIVIKKLETPNIQYKVYLDIVDKSYDLDKELLEVNILSKNIIKLMDEPNTELKNQLIQIITYLTQSAKVVFDKIKKQYSEILEYHIDMDYNTTIYLDADIEQRLGIKIQIFNVDDKGNLLE